MGININAIRDSKVRKRIRAALEVATAGGRGPEQKRHLKTPLLGTPPHTQGMVDLHCPVLVRIIRIGRVLYDRGDGLEAGAASLRDAIAAALSFPGDDEKDGIWFEYRQEIGEPETVIEIFRHDGIQPPN